MDVHDKATRSFNMSRIRATNTKPEIDEKKALYFEAGAQEFWICDANGKITFYQQGVTQPQNKSKLWPNFPDKVVLS